MGPKVILKTLGIRNVSRKYLQRRYRKVDKQKETILTEMLIVIALYGTVI